MKTLKLIAIFQTTPTRHKSHSMLTPEYKFVQKFALNCTFLINTIKTRFYLMIQTSDNMVSSKISVFNPLQKPLKIFHSKQAQLISKTSFFENGNPGNLINFAGRKRLKHGTSRTGHA